MGLAGHNIPGSWRLIHSRTTLSGVKFTDENGCEHYGLHNPICLGNPVLAQMQLQQLRYLAGLSEEEREKFIPYTVEMTNATNNPERR